jgi:hypothetical protein
MSDRSMQGNDGFVVNWATNVALGGPDTAPANGGLVVDWANEVALGGPDTSPADGGIIIDWASASIAPASGDDVMCSNNLLPGADGNDFIIIDYRPGEQAPSTLSDGLLPMESLRVDPSDPSVAGGTFVPVETFVPGCDILVEGITLVHEGYELVA